MGDWTQQQEIALDLAFNAIKNGRPLTTIGGYAGTGKTTISMELQNEWAGRIWYAAPTGKAVDVLKRKGAANAATIHSLIYKPLPSDQKEIDALREKLEQAYKDDNVRLAVLLEDQLRALNKADKPRFTLNEDSILQDRDAVKALVVDEMSMINEDLADDLMWFGVPIVAFGDPGQLPPVAGTGAWMDDIDYTLTEIHRQAKDNPILRLATQARMGEQIERMNNEHVQVLHRSQMDPKAVVAADQVIVGMNRTRNAWNDKYRRMVYGRDAQDVLLQGERLICRKNDKEQGLFNGSQWRVKNDPDSVREQDRYTLDVDIESLDGSVTVPGVAMHKDPFYGKEPVIPGRAIKFEYGYNITAHVSQGSQWDNTVVYDESYVFKDNGPKWLYTAITRAAERLTVLYD